MEAKSGPTEVVAVTAVDPVSIACDAALLACALETVGVQPHARFPFADLTEEIDGKPRRLWRWPFEAESADGLYRTAKLIEWWHDPAWSAANPTHEFAIVKAALKNFEEVARRMRTAIPRVLIRRGDVFAEIPQNASSARQAWALGQVEGRIPFGTPFVEPEASTA